MCLSSSSLERCQTRNTKHFVTFITSSLCGSLIIFQKLPLLTTKPLLADFSDAIQLSIPEETGSCALGGGRGLVYQKLLEPIARKAPMSVEKSAGCPPSNCLGHLPPSETLSQIHSVDLIFKTNSFLTDKMFRKVALEKVGVFNVLQSTTQNCCILRIFRHLLGSYLLYSFLSNVFPM